MDIHRVPVSECMRREFVSVAETDRLDFADRVLRLGHFRHLPVLEGRRLVGILSNRDLLAASLTKVLDFADNQRGTFLRAIEVSEVMTREVQSIGADAPVEEAARCMLEHKIGCLPVVEEDGTMIGLLTETDLIRAAYLTDPDDAD